MISAGHYRASLADGRAVWLDGHRVDDVTAHPLLAKSVDWVAAGFERFAGSENPIYRIPRTRDELVAQLDVILTSDHTAATTAGCMALTTVGHELAAVEPAYRDRLAAFAAGCRVNDRRVAAAVEDTARPLEVVARRDGGVVVRGGKQHVAGAVVANELMVVPAGPVGDDHPERAIAFAVPVGTPGVRLVTTTTAPRADDDRSFPVSRGHSISESVVIFDDVFVPEDRVFLDGAVSIAGRLASTLGVWERARAVADQADRAQLIMGLAQTISEMNGVAGVPHVRDKLASIAVWATMCRAGWESALANASVNEGGMVCCDDAFLYAAKAYGGHLASEMTHRLHDVAGGLVITCPSIADLDNPATGAYLRKYLRTMEGVTGEDRMRTFHVIRDLTADTYGGWDKVTSQVVGGGLHDQRMAALGAFDLDAARARARAAAGIA